MPNNSQDNSEPEDLLIESFNPKKDIERPKKLQSLIDTQAMRFLEGMDFRSYNNLSSACEQFMMEAPLFQSDVSFSAAAMALDLTAKLFSTIDTDRNSLLSREEFAYLLLKTNADNQAALGWLKENFSAFTQACFFKDQIAKDDIEAARHVFHGLKIAQEKFGFDKRPTRDNLSTLNPAELKDFLDKNGGSLNPQEVAGVKYLIDHIKKHVIPRSDKAGSALLAEQAELQKDNQLKVLEGIIDERSLQTLRELKLNNFEGLLLAFAEFLEDPNNFKGDNAFDKAGNAFDSTANSLDELEMGGEHAFTRDELRIVSKLSSRQDKKQIGWVAKHFDMFSKIFAFPGKAKKKTLLDISDIFRGLSFVRSNVLGKADARLELASQIRSHVAALQVSAANAQHKRGLDKLVEFIEKRASGLLL